MSIVIAAMILSVMATQTPGVPQAGTPEEVKAARIKAHQVEIGQMLDKAGVKSGMAVGEIGAGAGDLTFAMADRVGVSGQVYANDIAEWSVKIISKKDVPNVVPVLGRTDDPAFPRRNLDMLVMKNAFHDIENPLSLLEHARAYLKPQGTFVLIEPVSSGLVQPLTIAFHDMTEDLIRGIVKESSFEAIRADWLGQEPSRWIILTLRAAPERIGRTWAKWLEAFKSAVEEIERTERHGTISNDRLRIAWGRLLDAHRDNDPETEEDDLLRTRIQSRIWALDTDLGRAGSVSGVPGRLRTAYRRLDYRDLDEIVKKLGFVKTTPMIRSGDFPNRYESLSVEGDAAVADRASGLLWHPSGSDAPLDFYAAQEWIADLNSRRYAGRTDWRLPTLDELLTLLEAPETSRRAHVDPMFSDVQEIIWTGDDFYPGRAWAVNFGDMTATIWDILKTRVSWARPVASAGEGKERGPLGGGQGGD